MIAAEGAMSDQVDLSIRQFVGAWRTMCEGASQYVHAENDGVTQIFTGLPIPFFNVSLLTERGISAERLKSLADQSCAFASSQKVPWLFVVTHEAVDPGVDVTGVLDGCGLAPLLPLTGMRADHVAEPPDIPAGLRLTVPRDDEACASILDVNSAAYGMDLAASKPLLGRGDFWHGHFPVIGVADGAPASTAAVLMVDDIRYVALVATAPGQQRRGFADVTMRLALQVAADVHGQRPTVLHATDAGRPVYERMGYAVISTHTAFMDKAFLGGH
jgi:GNAT superfamily N-acetyltransferase